MRSKRVAVLGSLLLATSAVADDFSDRFAVHGFGYQDYAQASDNTYLGADDHGSWDNNFLGLVLTAVVNDRSEVWAQLEATTDEGTRFTWFFVDYQVSENLRAHVGRVKMPLGFYNETIDAKFLQVTQLEPSLYQTAADIVHDAYHGVGIDYEWELANGHVTWQLYGGNVYDVDPPEDSRDRRVVGGRVTYRTPVPGLRLMLSTYRTQVEVLADGTFSNEDRVIGSVEYLCERCDIKAEYATHEFLGVSSHAYYLQARYSIDDKWAPYVRYDTAVLDEDLSSDPSYYQKTFVVGVQYRMADSLTLRLENHFNHGYGLPVSSGEVAAGAGAVNWNLAVAGINFSF
jgi:hypothetical protein